jgi:hypothetical protein
MEGDAEDYRKSKPAVMRAVLRQKRVHDKGGRDARE